MFNNVSLNYELSIWWKRSMSKLHYREITIDSVNYGEELISIWSQEAHTNISHFYMGMLKEDLNANEHFKAGELQE